MQKLFSFRFWNGIARLILRNREIILGILVVITIGLASQWKHMQFSHSEANLLPDDHPVNIEYNRFLEQFGEEGNLIILGMENSKLTSFKDFNAWNHIADSLEMYPEVDFVLSTSNLPQLVKDTTSNRFIVKKGIGQNLKTEQEFADFKFHLFNELPFYKNLIYSEKDSTLRTAVYLKKDIVNTATRKDFVVEKLIPLINYYKTERGLSDLHTSGMPYIRTLNSENIVSEIGMFIFAALFVTSGIFFFFLGLGEPHLYQL